MKRSTTTLNSRRSTTGAILFATGALALTLPLGGCNNGGAASIGTSAGTAGDVVNHPDTGLRSKQFIVEENFRGQTNQLEVLGLFWGRLVDVFDFDATDQSTELQQVDFVVGEDIRTNSTFELATNPVTEKTTVTIKHPAGSPAYIQALKSLGANITPIQDKSLSPSELPPFSVAPRNSAIVVRFNDLLDPRYDGGWKDSFGGNLVSATTGQINSQALKVGVDYPPTQPFEARIIADPNHGDWLDLDGDQVMEFHTTRLIIDTTVSVVESGDSNPPLPVNALGLPEAITTQEPNLVVRIPTKLDTSVGQTQILTNAGKHPVSFSSSGSTDPNSVTMDVIRALRSGGESEVTGDANNGFLLDEERPRILGNLAVQIAGTPVPDPDVQGGFTIPQLVFNVPACALSPGSGDVLVQGTVRALVVASGSQDGSVVTGMRVQVLTPVNGVFIPGAAQLLSPFNPTLGDNPACFVRFSPTASAPPAGKVSKAARVILRFSEPMDPSSVAPFDSMTVTRTGLEPTAYEFVIGQVVPSSDLKEFVFAPVLDFAHVPGSAEPYYLNLASGADGPTDLAGNPLLFELPQITFFLDESESISQTAGLALRFNNNDEIGDDGFPEIRTGQVLFNFQQGVIRPRPVNRVAISADVDKPVPSVMTPFLPGVQTPLSPLGSKLQALWRYCDLGFSATDETNLNIDIEGMAWAPVGGQIVTDAYDEFSIRLGHSAWLPDESLNPLSGFPNYPNSGLVKTYNNNYLAPGVDEKIVHPRDRGYVVNPADLFTAQSGKLMLPWPLNKGIPIEQFNYYTWRDTRILGRAGFATSGVPLAHETAVTGSGTVASVYTTGMVRTLGLPLLMEFRCYPDTTALGLNAFEIALAANSSARPNFRAFSTGGHDTNNTQQIKDPDLETEATGGFNPNSTPPGGTTPGTDNSFYRGQLDLLTRVSLVHSIWLDTGFDMPKFAPVVVEPSASLLPAGTQVVLAYREARQISGQDMSDTPDDISTNAQKLDWYGDPEKGEVSSPVFLLDDTWRDNLSVQMGGRYFQFRITFLSNPVSNKSPELSALGFAFSL